MRSGPGSAPECLPKEVVFLGGGQGGMAVGGANHAELVGVGAEFLLQLHAALERLAGVFARKHGIGLGLGDVQVADIPGFIVGELVIGRQEGVGFAIALDLGGLVQGFPLGALFAQLLSSASPSLCSIMGNMMPLDRLPLWAMASTSPPVFFSYFSSHVHRSRGVVLPWGRWWYRAPFARPCRRRRGIPQRGAYCCRAPARSTRSR